MRTFIVFILSCVPVFGADTGIRVVTTTKTNAQTASVSTTDVFTRAGQTNLLRRTKTKAGAVQIRFQKFYYKGVHVCDYVARGDSSAGFSTEAGCPYSITLALWPSKEIRSVVFGTNGIVLDWFTCTNGVFTPIDGSVLKKANAFEEDLRALVSPAHVRNTKPEVYEKEIEQFIQQHQDK